MSIQMLNGVPIGILRHFGLDHRNLKEEDKRKLNDIHKWVGDGDLTSLQTKLGGDRTHNHVWESLRIKQSIDKDN